MTTKKKRARKPKQPFLSPEMEPPHFEAIDDAAGTFVERRDARMRQLEAETEAHDALLALMKEHKLETYEYDGLVVTLSHKDRCKVRRKDDSDSGGKDSAD